MGTHIFNLFELTNLKDMDGSYRLYAAKDIDTDWQQSDKSLKNLNGVLNTIAYQQRIPVALLLKDIPYFAIPADKELLTLDYQMSPHVLTLTPLADRKSINFKQLDRESERVAMQFLRFALQGPLMKDNHLWKSGASHYHTTPYNYKDSSRETDVYGGFAFRLLPMNGKIYAAIKLTYRYGDRKWLIDRYPNLTTSDCKMRHMLYHFGNRLYPVQFTGITGKTIAEQKFTKDNGEIGIVYNYTLEQTASNPPQWITTLNPSSPAITYKNPGSGKQSYGAAALCKMLLRTEDPEVQKLHSVSIMMPDKRLERTQSIITRYLNKGVFNGVPVKISDRPLETDRKVFPVPSQLFGQGKVLDVERNGTALVDLGKTRMKLLRDPQCGGLITGGFNGQYLFAPLSLERDIVVDFKARFEKALQEFFHGPYSMELIVYDDRKARTLKDQSDAITKASTNIHGYGILMLPRSSKPDLHNFIKKSLWEKIQFQCVNADKVRDFYKFGVRNDSPVFTVKPGSEQRYASYLRFTALGHLMVNRKWLWALKDPLHYDVSIGLDVLHNHAAFTFLYDNGKECFTRINQSKQKEKLIAAQTRTILYDNLKQVAEDLKKTGKQCRSIVLHRDGRTFFTEWKGFTAAIDLLQKEQLLENIEFGIVEVHKTSAYGFRLMSKENSKIGNPRIGSWAAISSSEGIVCNTGEPFPLRGTSNPLYVSIAHGNLNIEKVLQDIFSLSQLCWTTPSGCGKLPIDLKLSDELLKPVASDADDNEGMFGEEDSEGTSVETEERRVLI